MRYEIEEVAKVVLGINIMEEVSEDKLEDQLVEKFHTDLYHLEEIVKPLFKGMKTFISPITQEPYMAIIDKGLVLCKKQNDNFVNEVLMWMAGGDLNNKDSKGFKREITDKNGKPEFELILKRL